MKAVGQELGQLWVDVLDSDPALTFEPDKDEIEKCVGFGREVALLESKDLQGTENGASPIGPNSDISPRLVLGERISLTPQFRESVP